ncbi:alpha-isopropylmalate synthase regulatory domain-containing protein [Haliangium sp.]|uniref:alpha-isopropylmalate synthase regulatory domain-containing protein n=1 Tax=Haliangium sp. TaxID=2663208 RepID=UPI003D13B4B8
MTQRPHANLELIKRVLGDGYLQLELDRLTVDEVVSEETCSVAVEARDAGGVTVRVEGKGSGMVDAVFRALLARYAQEYRSLESIELANFQVSAELDTKEAKSGVDAMAKVIIEVQNSEGKSFTFSDGSRSVALSSARAVLAVVEYFVNAERAFITLYKSRKDAQDRHRDDLVARYTHEMAEVVKSTSYAEIIEQIKKELG